MSEMPNNITLMSFSWKDIEVTTKQVADAIIAAGDTPDMILGITRGGLVPLGLFARDLGVRNVASITAQSYNDMQQGELLITNAPDADMLGKKILIVDELADSGVTLQKIKSYIMDHYNPAEIKTAVLYVKEKSCDVYPDYFGKEIGDEENYWLHFPWEEAPGI